MSEVIIQSCFSDYLVTGYIFSQGITMSKHQWINLPVQEGEYNRQAHCDIPDGMYEREIGREGFFGPATHMLHKHPPTSWVDWQGDLRPRAYRLFELDTSEQLLWELPPILQNNDIAIRYWNLNSPMKDLVRNSDGDDLLFVHEGNGEFFCDYGHLTFVKGDYLLIPRGTCWRIETESLCTLLVIENHGNAYQLPDKGILGAHAIFDPAVLDYPRIDNAFKAQQDENAWQIHVKRLGKISTVTYPYNPLDAIGWHGNNTVYRLNWRDIRPLTSHRYHLPPSVHTTFVGSGFVVCTFCPRPIETDPGALKVPFFHNNDDYDEVIFYHEGNFFSRDHIEKGMLTFHPSGFTHGPHPKALKKSMTNPALETNEVAVMIDVRRPLEATLWLSKVEERQYVNSWKSPGKE